jgi:hypothetical protein
VPKGADGGLPGAPEGRDIRREMRVSETIQVREDERFDVEVQVCKPPPVYVKTGQAPPIISIRIALEAFFDCHRGGGVLSRREPVRLP